MSFEENFEDGDIDLKGLPLQTIRIIRELREGDDDLYFNEMIESEFRALLEHLKENNYNIEHLTFYFNLKYMGDNIYEEMLNAFEKYSSIKEINILAFPERQETRKKMVEFLGRRPNLETISFYLNEHNQQEELLEEMLAMLSKKPLLKTLKIQRLNLTKSISFSLSKFLLENKCVSKLELELLEGHKNSYKIFEALNLNKGVEELQLKSFVWQFLKEKETNSFLKENKTLKSLSFYNCSFYSSFTKQIAEFFSTNNSLTSLMLSDCSSSENYSFLDSLKTNSSFHSLSLHGVVLEEEETRNIMSLLEAGFLKELEIVDCFVSAEENETLLCGEERESFLGLLKKSHSLEKLSLIRFQLSKEQVSAIISENNHLQSLNVSDNKVCPQVFSLLKENKTLKSFACSDVEDDESEEAYYGVAEVIKENICLTELHLNEFKMSNKEQEEILKALCHNRALKVFEYANSCVNKLRDFSLFTSVIRASKTLKIFVWESDGKTEEELKETVEALKENSSLTKLEIKLYEANGDLRDTNLALQITKQLSLNRKIEERDTRTKLNMLILQKRRDGNIVSSVPRRLLVYLLSFLERVTMDKKELS